MSLVKLFSSLRVKGLGSSCQPAYLNLAKSKKFPAITSTSVAAVQARFMGVTKDDGVFKTWKPITPGLRGKKMVSRKHLWKGKPIRQLTIAKRRTGGRNFTGRITVRHRGGGAKRRIRMVDFYRKEAGEQEVVRLEYDPGRTAWIALLKHVDTGSLSYILAPENLKPGMIVQSYMSKLNERPARKGVSRPSDLENSATPAESPADAPEVVSEADSTAALEAAMLAADKEAEEFLSNRHISKNMRFDIGNCLPIKFIPPGTTIHNIGLDPKGKAKLARSAGASAKLLFTSSSGLAQIKLTSGEVRKIPVECCATIGAVSNPNHKHENLGKAGANRHRGWRPTVRGTAMNKHDHPNGGGRGKSKGNRQSTSPWGKLAKGGKTRARLNPLVIKHRKRK